MGCCVSKESDPVVRLANAPALSQKTLTFSKPMPHQQHRQSEGEDRQREEQLVKHRSHSHDESTDNEDGDVDAGAADLEAEEYVSPNFDGDGGGAVGSDEEQEPKELVFESGWLKKEPLHLKGRPKELALKRQERFFHLKGTVLLYYADACDTKGVSSDGGKAKLKGGIKLAAGVSTVKLQGRRITVTGLTTQDKEASLYLFVRSAEDGDKWVGALTRAIEYVEAMAPPQLSLDDESGDEGAGGGEGEEDGEHAEEEEIDQI